jgi:hypothetical protein
MGEPLVDLVAGLEGQLPLERARLKAFFAGLPAGTPRFQVDLRLPQQLSLRFTPATACAVARHFPGGHHLPPPPPGVGAPAELEGAYVVDRPWGRLWFTLHRGDRVAALALEPGVHGSPGV